MHTASGHAITHTHNTRNNPDNNNKHVRSQAATRQRKQHRARGISQEFLYIDYGYSSLKISPPVAFPH